MPQSTIISPKKRFCAEAQNWVGTPFLHRGRSKQSGVDCLGLIMACYEKIIGKFEADIPDYPASRSTFSHRGLNCQFLAAVFEKSEHFTPEMGDVLVFEIRPNTYWHLAIALDEREMVHAHARRGVEIVPCDENWHEILNAIYKIRMN